MSAMSWIAEGINLLGMLYVALVIFSGIYDLISGIRKNRKARAQR